MVNRNKAKRHIDIYIYIEIIRYKRLLSRVRAALLSFLLTLKVLPVLAWSRCRVPMLVCWRTSVATISNSSQSTSPSPFKSNMRNAISKWRRETAKHNRYLKMRRLQLVLIRRVMLKNKAMLRLASFKRLLMLTINIYYCVEDVWHWVTLSQLIYIFHR